MENMSGKVIHMTTPDDRVRWLNDLVHLEIVLWEQVDAALKEAHGLPLAHFQALDAVAQSPDGLRVGDLARRMRITVGGASKVADRIDASGLVRRAADPGDRRASRIVLTPAGRALLPKATETYAAHLATLLDPILPPTDQRHLHDLVHRLLTATDRLA
jgi:MarR family transcriptional regulator, organic hydroperoxide resistance regulator